MRARPESGCDERAEREQQDDEGDRQRQLLRLLQVLADRVLQLVVRARLAELGDRERGDARCRFATASSTG